MGALGKKLRLSLAGSSGIGAYQRFITEGVYVFLHGSIVRLNDAVGQD